MKTNKLVLPVILTTTLCIGGYIVAQTAYASENTTTKPQTVWDKVAEKLGVPDSDLINAFKDSSYEIIDEKVDAGILTSTQAEEIKARIASKDSLPPIGMKRRGRFGKIKHDEIVAKYLDISVDELKADRDEGLTMLEILEKYSKSREDFHIYMEENRPTFDKQRQID